MNSSLIKREHLLRSALVTIVGGATRHTRNKLQIPRILTPLVYTHTVPPRELVKVKAARGTERERDEEQTHSARIPVFADKLCAHI